MKTVTIEITKNDLQWDGIKEHWGDAGDCIKCPGFQAARRVFAKVTSFAFDTFGVEVSGGAIAVSVPRDAADRLIRHLRFQRSLDGGEETAPFSFEVVVPDGVPLK